jgi:hypothetical protein
MDCGGRIGSVPLVAVAALYCCTSPSLTLNSAAAPKLVGSYQIQLGWILWPAAKDSLRCRGDRWLHTDQTIRNANGDQIANAHDVKQIVFLENGTQDVKMLPGSLFMPPVAFDLDPHQPLTVTLQWLIDIQLEGDSLFRFGSLGGLMPTVLRTSNWTLQRT